MAYDEQLADRVRELLRTQAGLSEKRMFGGLGFMIDGNLAVSASSQGGLLLRVEPAQVETLIADPQATRFVMRNREMNGWLHIDLDGGSSGTELERWVSLGVAYARSLPSKA